MSVWEDHPELVAELKELADAGYSASKIARALGHGITRNAAIGKLTRLGVQRQPSGRSVSSPRPKRQPSQPKAPYLPPEPITAEPPLTLEDGKKVTVMTVSDRHCRWPIGDPRDAGFHFCGQPPKPGHVYCSGHCQIGYAGLPQRKSGAA